MREYSAGMYPYTATEYGFDVHTWYVQREMREYSAGMYPYTATEGSFGVHTGYVQQQQQRAAAVYRNAKNRLFEQALGPGLLTCTKT